MRPNSWRLPLSFAAAACAALGLALITHLRERAPPIEGVADSPVPATPGREMSRSNVARPRPRDRAQTLAEQWTKAWAEPDSGKRMTLLLRIAQRAALSEFSWLLDSTAQWDDPDLRFELRRRLLARWAQAQGATAMAYLQTLPETERPELVPTLVAEWAAANPVAAVRWFADADGTEHTATASALAGALTHLTLAEVLDLTRFIPDEPARAALCAALIENWKTDQPGAAANLALSAATGQVQADLFGQIIPQWGQTDLPAAVDWVRRLSPGLSKTTALIHLGYTWAQTAPEQAAAFARDLPAGNEQFLAILIGQWAQQDRPRAAEWAQQMPEGPAKDRALVALANTWAGQDPRGAMEFAARLQPGTAQQNAVISAISGWTAQDPGMAAQWVSGFLVGPQREYAIENVFYAWTQTDPLAAVAWLQRLPAGLDRDTALHAGAGSLIDAYPDLAAQLAVGIHDQALRDRQTERAARAWLAKDPKAARAWIEQSALSLTFKRRLL